MFKTPFIQSFLLLLLLLFTDIISNVCTTKKLIIENSKTEFISFSMTQWTISKLVNNIQSLSLLDVLRIFNKMVCKIKRVINFCFIFEVHQKQILSHIFKNMSKLLFAYQPQIEKWNTSFLITLYWEKNLLLICRFLHLLKRTICDACVEFCWDARYSGFSGIIPRSNGILWNYGWHWK